MSKQKIVLIGAGSLTFGLGTVGSIFGSEALSGATICLHDINEETLEVVTRTCKSALEKKGSDFTIESTTDRKEALKNATFIINSLEITPRFGLLRWDFEFPMMYGSKQITGENGGPGGFFHSLRVIPPILDICKDIQKISPNALFINFSNPMSRICLAIKRKFPNQRFVGLCHEIHNAIIWLPRILDTHFKNLDIKAGGLNHFGVVLEAKYRDTGKDAYPDIRKKAPAVLDEINTGTDVSLTKFILEKYDYLPYTTDNHYGEYISWAWEVANLYHGRQFWEGYEKYSAKTFERMKRAISKGEGSRLVRAGGERAIPIIEGILNDDNHLEFSVNLPNDGIITNLPEDLIVECPAIVNNKGLQGVKLGEYPKGLAALLNTQAGVQDLVIEAILTKSKKIALQALLADPVVNSTSQAERILESMLDLQKNKIQIELV
ncbi:MAG: family 4 glycosyl hydrolase [Candidatus Hodarchaeales archaeon]|jgi:alpha-galactosidase